MAAKKASPLTKKLGPLPVWAWLLVIGGGALAGLWLRSRISSSSSGSGSTLGGAGGSDTGQPQYVATGGGDQGSGSTSGTGETAGLSPDLVAALLQAQEQGFGESLGLASSIFDSGVNALSYSEQFATDTFGESLGFAESSQAAAYQFADSAREAAAAAGPGPSAPAPSQPQPGASNPPPPSGEQSSGGTGPVYAASYTVPTTGGHTAVVPGGPISPATGLSGHGPQL